MQELESQLSALKQDRLTWTTDSRNELKPEDDKILAQQRVIESRTEERDKARKQIEQLTSFANRLRASKGTELAETRSMFNGLVDRFQASQQSNSTLSSELSVAKAAASEQLSRSQTSRAEIASLKADLATVLARLETANRNSLSTTSRRNIADYSTPVKFSRSPRKDIRIEVTEWEGQVRVDVREWWDRGRTKKIWTSCGIHRSRSVYPYIPIQLTILPGPQRSRARCPRVRENLNRCRSAG